MALSETIKKAIPWIEPVLDYFDWRKRLVAGVVAVAIGGWSLMKGEPWPVIVTLAFTVLVMTAYALVFPAFVKLINVGYKPKPDPNIWKHKTKYKLWQAAALLADAQPVELADSMSDATRAWFEILCDAVKDREISYIPSPFDDNHTFNDGYYPYEETTITRESLKVFCSARHRSPEFLAD